MDCEAAFQSSALSHCAEKYSPILSFINLLFISMFSCIMFLAYNKRKTRFRCGTTRDTHWGYQGVPQSPFRLVWDIDDTNREGRTRSGINTSVGPDPSAETEGLHEGLALHEC